jgi:uncharacterized phiE125 gp8 family phage protein
VGLELLEGPDPEDPVATLAEAQDQVRSWSAKDEDYLVKRVKAATAIAEGETNRRLVEQSWKLTLNAFPSVAPDGSVRHAIRLPYPPLISVESVKYLDAAGVLQTLVPNVDYLVRAAETPGEIVPAYGKCWPSTRCIEDAVRVEFTCGYGAAADVPELLKSGILLLVGTLYANRETVAPVEMREIPQSAAWIFEKFRVVRWSETA